MRTLLVVCSFLLALLSPMTGTAALTGSAPAPDAHAPSTGHGCGRQQVASASWPVGVGRCPGVRPGGMVRIPTPQGDRTCTLNFVFLGREGDVTAAIYIGTAGHCILGESSFTRDAGERAWPRGQGPKAYTPQGKEIGEFAYAVLQGEFDFALIRVRPDVGVSPQMCHFGGPTGLNIERPAAITYLQYYGQGFAVGTAVPARTAMAYGMPDRHHVFANGVAAPGDSGAGVVSTDGRAVGVVVTTGAHIGSIGGRGVDAGTIGISRLYPQMARAAWVLRQRFVLVLAPQL